MTNRPRNLTLAPAFFSLTLSLILFTSAFAQPVHFAPAPNAIDLINAVNALRAENNLQAYQVSPILMNIAQMHAEYMAKSGVVTHFDSAGMRPYQRAINAGYPVAGDLSQGGFFSENIYSGQKSATPADVIKDWSADSLHLGTLLSPDLKDIGIGFAEAAGAIYYVLDAGSATVDANSNIAAFTATPSAVKTESVIISTPLEDGSIYHIAQPQEALWSIAIAYNMTIADLKKINRLASDEIFEGQKLLIFKPKPGPTITPTAGVTFTATFGIPSSTATEPVEATLVPTATPQPVSPASARSSGIIVGVIVLIAILGAGIGSWVGKKKG